MDSPHTCPPLALWKHGWTSERKAVIRIPVLIHKRRGSLASYALSSENIRDATNKHMPRQASSAQYTLA